MASAIRAPLLLAILFAGCFGQEANSGFVFGGASRGFTILDQVQDARERRAITALLRESNSHRRRDLALAFLRDYPDSWLLAQVYEMAAKASLEIGDFKNALTLGKESLRLLPENPLLLVPLANAQAKEKELDAAVRNAISALQYLDRFGRPSSIEEKSWPAVKDALRASSYFVLGRVSTLQALTLQGSDRARRLADAEEALTKGFNLVPEDPDISYLLGLVYLLMDKPDLAGPQIAKAYLLPGPESFKAAAKERLQALHRKSDPSGGATFEQFVSSLRARAPLPQQAPVKHAATAPPAYAGTQVCLECHRSEHKSWTSTGMGRMFAEYRPENVIGDFESGNAVADHRGQPVARPLLIGGKHYLEIRNPGGRWAQYPVHYTIGSKWQQAYATRLDDGKIQVFPIQYNAARKLWLNYWSIIDEPDSARAEIIKFRSAVPEANYQVNCAPCHTSQLRFTGNPMEPAAIDYREPGINCEMCHGPSAGHAQSARAGQIYRKSPADPPVDFKRLDAGEYVLICGQCHMQSAMRRPEAGGAINYSETGSAFYRTYPLRPYVDFSRKAFYKDGRFRETTFIVESFLRAACFRRGKAHCGHCHNPHPENPASNPASLKFADSDSDRMCLQCHDGYTGNEAAHTRHSASSEASRCVSCHMPRIMNALLFSARTHRIDDIPDAAMAGRFGREESPNACLGCHADRDTEWLRVELAKW